MLNVNASLATLKLISRPYQGKFMILKSHVLLVLGSVRLPSRYYDVNIDITSLIYSHINSLFALVKYQTKCDFEFHFYYQALNRDLQFKTRSNGIISITNTFSTSTENLNLSQNLIPL